jgi:WD40 repeat protein
VHDWNVLHVLGGHKGPVLGLGVHPTGKLALSTGRDRTLRLWDLVNGRCSFITRLEVKWAVLKSQACEEKTKRRELFHYDQRSHISHGQVGPLDRPRSHAPAVGPGQRPMLIHHPP